MVWIKIDNEAWALYKKSWKLLGTRKHTELVKMLERYIRESSLEVLIDARKDLITEGTTSQEEVPNRNSTRAP